jgi:excinuclease UvrABC ATPase subunit
VGGAYFQLRPVRSSTSPSRIIREKNAAIFFELDDGRKVKVNKINITYEGVVAKLKKGLGSKDPEQLQPHVRLEYERIFTRAVCPACHGARLNRQALASTVEGHNIAELSAMQVSDLADLVRTIQAPQVGPMLEALAGRLENLVTIGLGYLSLDRESSTLSGGESQRVKMVRHLGSSLTDITYVFDEPSVGLHPHDVGRLAGLMQQLRDKGNTVLIVEHKPDMIAIADHVVDMGPYAGSKGGEVVYEGDFAGLLTSGTLTGNHMSKHQPIKDKVRKAKGEPLRSLMPAQQSRDVSVSIRAMGVLTVVTGVAGSGKSSPDPGLPAQGLSRHHHHRPEPGARLAPLQYRDLYRHSRQCPQGLRQGQWRRSLAVLGQFQGRLPRLQRPGRHLYRSGPSRSDGHHLRDLRGQALPARSAGPSPARQVHQRCL